MGQNGNTYKSNGIKKERNNKRVPLVITYAKNSPNVDDITQKHVNILYKLYKMKKISQQPPFIADRRQKFRESTGAWKSYKVLNEISHNKQCNYNCLVNS